MLRPTRADRNNGCLEWIRFMSGKYRILVVDDDEDTRHMLHLALQERYEVVEATDGLDALSRLEDLEPDVAIIDYKMPMMDGHRLCEAIRRHREFNHMPVLFLSAYGSRETVKRSYAKGANLFMTKPVDPMRVLRNVDFTVSHDRPPLRRKTCTVEQIEQKRAQQRKKQQPAPEPRPEAAPPHPETPQKAGRSVKPKTARMRPRVLVVDDDPETVHMLELTLVDDYEVVTASDGMEAIERVVSDQPDMLIVDVMMPKLNGYQLIQSVKRNLYYRHLPIVVLSAKTSARDRTYAMRLGACEVLPKPYQIDRLRETLEGIEADPLFKVRPKDKSIESIRQARRRTQKAQDEDEKEIRFRD